MSLDKLVKISRLWDQKSRSLQGQTLPSYCGRWRDPHHRLGVWQATQC